MKLVRTSILGLELGEGFYDEFKSVTKAKIQDKLIDWILYPNHFGMSYGYVMYERLYLWPSFTVNCN